MREIKSEEIKNTVYQLCLEANFFLPKEILYRIKKAYRVERNALAKRMLKILLENAFIAQKEKLPICQDTGMVVIFIEMGQELRIIGEGLSQAINKGVKEAYLQGYLRKSVCEPFSRKITEDNTPAVVHLNIVEGERLEITAVIKGFGAENKSQIRMFEPTSSIEEIKGFVCQVVKEAGPDACPPFWVGVGIGGSFEQAAILAKEATLRKIQNKKQNSKIAQLEMELLSEINKLNIGPMGLGGKTTALGVNILTFPTHIAGLPVAVNLSCHATRWASRTI